MKKFETNYVVLNYKVMYRHDSNESWHTAIFETEEQAIDYFRKVFSSHYNCKMLKIEALESWWTK